MKNETLIATILLAARAASPFKKVNLAGIDSALAAARTLLAKTGEDPNAPVSLEIGTDHLRGSFQLSQDEEGEPLKVDMALWVRDAYMDIGLGMTPGLGALHGHFTHDGMVSVDQD